MVDERISELEDRREKIFIFKYGERRGWEI